MEEMQGEVWAKAWGFHVLSRLICLLTPHMFINLDTF